eukprot:4153789-Pyramimonas_sp.AAC.1
MFPLEKASLAGAVYVDVKGIRVDVKGIRVDVKGIRVDVIGIYVDVVGIHVDVIGIYVDVIGIRVDVIGMYICASASKLFVTTHLERGAPNRARLLLCGASQGVFGGGAHNDWYLGHRAGDRDQRTFPCLSLVDPPPLQEQLSSLRSILLFKSNYPL